jgi:hypothetical protein
MLGYIIWDVFCGLTLQGRVRGGFRLMRVYVAVLVLLEVLASPLLSAAEQRTEEFVSRVRGKKTPVMETGTMPEVSPQVSSSF